MSAQPIQFVNAKSPLIRQSKWDIIHPGGHIYALKISHNGHLLATASTCGSVRLWDTHTWQIVYELRVPPSLSNVKITPVEGKNTEPVTKQAIDEFYFVEFSPDDMIVAVGGKRKDRHEWDPIDDDNKILPCPVILFDLKCIASGGNEEKDYNISADAVTLLNGHTEEVLCIKSVTFNNEFYYVTGSFDGSIIKWKMNDDYKTQLGEHCMIMDGITNVVNSIDFVPETNNKYLVAGADDSIKIYDFEAHQLLQTFTSGYGSYCDCVKFVQLLDVEEQQNGEEEVSYTLITRGIEQTNEETNIPLANNKCHVRKLTFSKKSASKGKKKDNLFNLETVSTFMHPEYTSNSWLIKINSNGRYLFAPTSNGKVFIWNIKTTKLAAILHDHAEDEVRDVILHKTRPLLLTCGDDATVKVYKSEPKVAMKRREITTVTSDTTEKTYNTDSSVQQAQSTQPNQSAQDDAERKETTRAVAKKSPKSRATKTDDNEQKEIEEILQVFSDEEENEEDDQDEDYYEISSKRKKGKGKKKDGSDDEMED
jgi:WD40 repeat protein